MRNLKRLMDNDWETARLIHKYEGEIFLKRSETRCLLEFGELTLTTEVSHPEDEKRLFQMDAHFREEDISYIAFYQPKLIQRLG